jgi:hypothetical protein
MAIADSPKTQLMRTRTWKTAGTYSIDPKTANYFQLKTDLGAFGESATQVNRIKDFEACIRIPGTDIPFRRTKATEPRAAVITNAAHSTIPKSGEPLLRERIATLESGSGIIADPDVLFWSNLGEGGARWLLARMNERLGMRQLWRIADLLTATYGVSVNPILSDLEAVPSPRKASALLSALTAVSPAALRQFIPRIESILRRYLGHPDDAVRSQAAGAIGIIPDPSATVLLRDALTRETDDDVIGALEEELAQRSHL